MNEVFDLSARRLVVKVFGEKGIRLDATHPGNQATKNLEPGSYFFYTTKIRSLDGKSEKTWAIWEKMPSFGIPLERLRKLDNDPNCIVEVHTPTGKRFFT